MADPTVQVKLVVLPQGYRFAMSLDGVAIGDGQGPIASLGALVGRLNNDPAFGAVSYSAPTAISNAGSKFTGDLPAADADALAAGWRDFPVISPND